MKKKAFLFLSAIFIAFMLVTACTDTDEQDRIFDDMHDQITDEWAQATPQNGTEQEENNIADNGDVAYEQSLTILISDDWYRWGGIHRLFLDHFRAHRPDVELVIEIFQVRDPHTFDVAEQTALITRLLADPPDIFIRPEFVSYEKLNVEALFIDLNDYIDGPDGINRDDYFDNIFRAAQTGGSLFYVPLMVEMNTVLLSESHFENIGVDIAEKRTISLRESFDYFHRAAALSYRDLFLEWNFNLTEIFVRESVYDIETGEVFAYTPEMVELLLEAGEIPLRPGIEYLPDHVNTRFEWRFPAVDEHWFYDNYLLRDVGNLATSPWVTLLSDYHPAMPFSRPIHRITEGGEISFANHIGMSIMRSSQNRELAWEFLRFCMEIEESHVAGFGGHGAFPTNRARFDNWASDIMHFGYDQIRPGRFFFSTIDLVDPTEAIADGVAHFRGLMEMINAEDRRNIAVFNSMIYPDLFLFATGSQEAGQTLLNIQNRLELYIHE